MASSKYYAVKKGQTPGIYRTWDACKAQVHGVTGATYKSFKTESEAIEYMGDVLKVQLKQTEEPISGVVAYVDGSYNNVTKEFSYGVIILIEGQEYEFAMKMNDPELASMRNVAGEIKGAEAAMRYAVEHNLPGITIYHDYEGISKWCLNEWKANKEGTKAYKAYYDSIKDIVNIRFVKVKGHSNDKYNDVADRLAKEALGII